MRRNRGEGFLVESTTFFSVWAQESSYWLVVEGAAASSLKGFSPIARRAELAAQKTSADWHVAWLACHEQLTKHLGATTVYRAAVIAAEELPPLEQVMAALMPVPQLEAVAANLWLIEAIRHGQLGCYMQRVVDRRSKQVGFEAFARIEAADNAVIGGGAIMHAASVLKVEYQLDRLLHKQAIDAYVASDLEGYLFINFLTGFVHRPEVYLDGLSQAVSRAHMRPGAVVLDVPLGDYAKDMAKLKSIAEYCRSRGFALALDDVLAHEGLDALLLEISPAFVKLGGAFGRGLSPARAEGMRHEIVRICHARGVSVLAEGVENTEQYEQYVAANVDMFQGYLFGAPERMRPSAATARA